MKQLLTSLFFIGAISTLSHSDIIDYRSCASDYETLEAALRNTSRNVFLLTTVFFPPHMDSPLYVTVTYNFSTTSVDYIWSTAILYLVVHPTIISYLSLFFSYIETNRVVHLELQLPEDCSDLANNTKSDTSNLLFILTHRVRTAIIARCRILCDTYLSVLQLQHYAQDSTDLEDLNAHVVSAENRKNHHDQQNVALFSSLVVVLPVFTFVLILTSVFGVVPYIRSHINDSDNFPRVAALYWIGLTFAVYVSAMDVVALLKNEALDERDTLLHYQFIIIVFITAVEGLGAILCFILALVPLSSHAKNPKCKSFFESYYGICCGIISKEIDRKEARVWLFLSSLVTTITALSSHAGFIISGWVSYEERSVTVFLLYVFVFVFLYWSLQYMYRFSTIVVNSCIRKNQLCCYNKGSSRGSY